jgi:hypothetical protein
MDYTTIPKAGTDTLNTTFHIQLIIHNHRTYTARFRRRRKDKSLPQRSRNRQRSRERMVGRRINPHTPHCPLHNPTRQEHNYPRPPIQHPHQPGANLHLRSLSRSTPRQQNLLTPSSSPLLNFVSITTQGLPFYAGNVTYHCSLSVPSTSTKTNSNVTLHIPHFSSPVLAVHSTASGEKLGRIAFQPRTLELGELSAGRHGISITAYGNQNNAFRHVH